VSSFAIAVNDVNDVKLGFVHRWQDHGFADPMPVRGLCLEVEYLFCAFVSFVAYLMILSCNHGLRGRVLALMASRTSARRSGSAQLSAKRTLLVLSHVIRACA
jgi:hypothetical protein